MTGTDKLKPLVIGKSLKPRCYTGIKMDILHVIYKTNSKAWNAKLQRKNKKSLLMMDNCPAHKLIGNYKNIEIQQTTAVLQPLGQGVIKNFKFYYRMRLVNR